MIPTIGLILIDLCVVTICTFILWKHARLSALHPAVAYLGFHIYVVTLRLIAIERDFPVLFGLSQDEIMVAAIAAELALISSTIGFVFAAHRATLVAPVQAKAKEMLSKPLFVTAAVTVALFGAWGMLMYRNIDLDRLQSWQTSNYFTQTVTWMAFAAIILAYAFSVRWWTLVLCALAIADVMTCAPRYMLVIPVVFLTYAHLSARNRRWPSVLAVVALIGVASLWFSLKPIVGALREGGGLAEVFRAYRTQFDEVREFGHGLNGGDTMFLDQAAAYMSAADEREIRFYGVPWLQAACVVIPRFLWPDKPALNAYAQELTSVDRPIAENGMVPTMFGDCYINFGYLGDLVIPGVVAFLLGLWYYSAIRAPHLSLARYSYCAYAANLLQVWRDDMAGLFLRPLFMCMPLTFVVMASIFVVFQRRYLSRFRGGGAFSQAAS